MKNLGFKTGVILASLTAITIGVITYIKRQPKISVEMIDYKGKKARLKMSANKLMSEKEYSLGESSAIGGAGYEINMVTEGEKMIFTIKKGKPIATKVVKQTIIDFKNQTKIEK